MSYTFEEYNGNCGDVYEFETVEEALDAAEYKWNRNLNARQKKAYLARKNGEVFMVCDSEGMCIKNFLEE